MRKVLAVAWAMALCTLAATTAFPEVKAPQQRKHGAVGKTEQGEPAAGSRVPQAQRDVAAKREKARERRNELQKKRVDALVTGGDRRR